MFVRIYARNTKTRSRGNRRSTYSTPKVICEHYLSNSGRETFELTMRTADQPDDIKYDSEVILHEHDLIKVLETLDKAGVLDALLKKATRQ